MLGTCDMIDMLSPPETAFLETSHLEILFQESLLDTALIREAGPLPRATASSVRIAIRPGPGGGLLALDDILRLTLLRLLASRVIYRLAPLLTCLGFLSSKFSLVSSREI